MFESILVPVDFSEGSAAALEMAMALSEVHSAKVTLLHVSELAYVYGVEGGLVAESSPGFLALRTRHLEAQRARLEAVAEGRALVTREGHAAEQILEQIKDGGHDLVVMGTHGRSGISRLVAGSTAERVVRESPVPVLTLRREGAA